MTLTLDPLNANRGIDLDKLKVRHPALYKIVVRQTNLTTGVHALDFGIFPAEGSQRYVLECSAPLPVQEPQIDMAEVESEQQASIKKAADEAAAKARLEEYAALGLEETSHNFELIRDYVNNSEVHGYWSSEIVDIAIQWLGPRSKNVLTWKPKEAPAPPPPPSQEPVEVLEPWQLPLNADEHSMKRADVRALKDLLSRRRAQASRYYRAPGTFGSNF